MMWLMVPAPPSTVVTMLWNFTPAAVGVSMA